MVILISVLVTMLHAFNSSGDTGGDKFGRSSWLRLEGSYNDVALWVDRAEFKLKLMCTVY